MSKWIALAVVCIINANETNMKKQNYIKYKSTMEADDFGEFRKWFKNNYFDEEKSYKDLFDLTENDLEKFEPKKKTKRKQSE